MQQLVRHPDSPASPVRRVSAAVRLREGGVRIRYEVAGDMQRVVVPTGAPSARADDLWRTTCFELFWQGDGRDAYTEINLSPSSRWAAWRFGGYREDRTDLAIPALSISAAHHSGRFVLDADLAVALPLPAHVAPTAVIESTDGSFSYWAPAFAPGKPDFHAAECRILTPEPQ